MKTYITGGPAFPQHSIHGGPATNGMCLRDWFAGQAMLGLIASGEAKKIADQCEVMPDGKPLANSDRESMCWSVACHLVSERASKMANAMTQLREHERFADRKLEAKGAPDGREGPAAEGGAMSNVLACAYCGQEYPPGTPASQHERLTQHIEVCEKHPMREVVAERDRLRAQVKVLSTPEWYNNDDGECGGQSPLELLVDCCLEHGETMTMQANRTVRTETWLCIHVPCSDDPPDEDDYDTEAVGPFEDDEQAKAALARWDAGDRSVLNIGRASE